MQSFQGDKVKISQCCVAVSYNGLNILRNISRVYI